MTLDIGFLGYRFMGEAHANALDRIPMFFPDAPLVNRSVLVGRTAETTDAAADRLGFDTTTTDWAAALNDVDVFYNLGPTHVHVDPTVAALDRDIHVLCEKPLAPTSDGAARIAAAARKSDATLAVGFNYRYVPALRLAKQLLNEGRFGDVRRFRGHYLQDWQADPDEEWGWRNDAGTAGTGVLGDQGSHTLDLARWFVGDVDRIVGHLDTFVTERPAPGEDETRSVTTDDEYTAIASFENGATGVFEASRVAPGHRTGNVVEVYGSEGGFRFAMQRINELEIWTAESDGIETVLVTDDDHPYMNTWWPAGHVIGWEHCIIHENYEFVSAIADGEPYEPGIDAGLAVQRLVDAIERSHKDGSYISV